MIVPDQTLAYMFVTVRDVVFVYHFQSVIARNISVYEGKFMMVRDRLRKSHVVSLRLRGNFGISVRDVSYLVLRSDSAHTTDQLVYT